MSPPSQPPPPPGSLDRERLLERVLGAVSEGVLALDRDGRVAFSNDVGARLVGRPDAAALLGERLADVVAPFERWREDGSPWSIDELPSQVALRGGRVEGALLGWRRAPGDVARWAVVTAAPVLDAAGRVELAILSLREVTDRRRLEDAQRAVARVTELMAGAPLEDVPGTLRVAAASLVPALADWCVCYLVEDDALRWVIGHADPARARAAEELLDRWPPRPGQGVYEVIRTGAPELVPAVPDEALAAFARSPEHLEMLRGAAIRSYVCVPLRARRSVVGALTLVSSEPGRRYGADDVVRAQDLADRLAVFVENARLYAETRSARHLAETASRAKDEFLAMLGHELRNPLSPILTAVELMKLRAGDALAREREIIERQVRHLVRLVDDLLDVSRITRGKVELHRARVELADVVARSIEVASPLLEQRRHRLTVAVPRGEAVVADEHRLTQVVSNLLTNAAKYTDPGGRIHVGVTVDGGDLVLAVEDTGVGIPPELLDNVFGLFVQGERSLDRAQGGLGLGLALVKSLVELHGGAVEARSEGPGRGSTFVVRLPRAPVVPGEAVAARPAPAADPWDPGRRVLVVDDNPDVADSLVEALRELGYDARGAGDGPEALEVAARFEPEAALLDIGLPVMDGYELARRLRERPGGEELKLIAVTGYGQPEDRARAREAGFDEHLVKPVDLARIEAALDRLVGGPRRAPPPPPPP